MEPAIERTIRESPLFKHLTEDQIEALIDASSLISPPPNTVLVEENQPVDYLYIVERGRVHVSTDSPSKAQVDLKTMGPGAYFGEVSLISGKNATATVKTGDPKTLLVTIDKDVLSTLVEEDEKIRRMLQSVTLARAKDTIGKVLK